MCSCMVRVHVLSVIQDESTLKCNEEDEKVQIQQNCEIGQESGLQTQEESVEV